jgi:hypothetical protein
MPSSISAAGNEFGAEDGAGSASNEFGAEDGA